MRARWPCPFGGLPRSQTLGKIMARGIADRIGGESRASETAEACEFEGRMTRVDRVGGPSRATELGRGLHGVGRPARQDRRPRTRE